jgi:hypothetical protein
MKHDGEIATDWPVPWIPVPLQRLQTISLELLEDEIEREAEIAERW